MLKKLSIRGRLMAGFGMVALLSVIMVILGLSSAQSIRGRYTELIEGPIAVVDYIKDARLHINAMARIVRDMALDPSAQSIRGRYTELIEGPIAVVDYIKDARLHINAMARIVRDMALDPDTSNYSQSESEVNVRKTAVAEILSKVQAEYDANDNYAKQWSDSVVAWENEADRIIATLKSGRKTAVAEILSKVQAEYDANDNYAKQWSDSVVAWENEADRIIATLKSGNRIQAMDMLVHECTPLLLQMNEQAMSATTSMVTERDAAVEGVKSHARTAVILIAILMVFTAAVIFLLGVRITRSIVGPLHEMKNTMIAMSQGDLHTECNYTGNDEVGATVEALHSSQQTLADLTDTLDSTLEQMAEGNFKVSLDVEFPGDLGSIKVSMEKLLARLNEVMMTDTLDSTLEQMAEGNFKVSLDVEFPGDLGSIKVSMEKLLARLNEVMMQLRNSGDQVSAGSEQVSSGAQALAQGATEQASSVEELSATISEISSASKENAKSATQVRALANEAGASIEKSTEQMQEMLAAMDDISNSSSEIGKIIKTIEDIAFQTNILALNAAVEAARAGTAGKGFAVVADEVRNLASKSAEASKNTAALIEQAIHAVERGSTLATGTAKTLDEASAMAREAVKNIDHIASKNTAALIEQAIHAVERGSTLATGTAKTLDEASAMAREAVKNIDHITNAIDQEASSIEQITIGIDQISAVVQTNSATSEEAAAASEELSSQAQMMHSLLSYFQLKDDANAPLGFDGGAGVAQQSHYEDDFDSYTPPMQSIGSSFDKY